MLECSLLFLNAKKSKRKIPILGKQGVVTIHFNGKLNSLQINNLINDINFIISVYKKGCRKIQFICDGVFEPRDMFVYVLFETFIYTLRCKYGYDVEYQINEVRSHIHAPGINDSLLLYFYKSNFDIASMEKNYKMIHNHNHFRRIISKDNLAGASILLGELKIFFSVFDFDSNYGLQLAKVASELVDNACEHANSDCLVDVYVSDPTYRKKDCDIDFYAISMVVVNFSDKLLSYDIKQKIKNKEYKESERYCMVGQALEKHKPYFRRSKYEEDDFYNIVSFQDHISGRKNETRTGGTGLTDLIKSLEDKAEAHCCYVLSGNKGLWFEPEYLRYNSDNWIGFNDNNDFINCIPNEEIIVRSDVEFLGTGYNFALIVKKEERIDD